MNVQSYYLTTFEKDANVCDLSVKVKLNCTGMIETTDGFYTHYCRHDFYLMYMLDGSIQVSIKTFSSVIRKGDLLILFPETAYSCTSLKGEHTLYRYIHFTGRSVKSMLDYFGLPCNEIMHIGFTSEIDRIFQSIYQEYILHDKYFDFESVSLLKLLLCQFSRKKSANASINPFTKSISYINENYTSFISINSLAMMENMCESYYRRTFKRLTGMTPNEYIINKRINQAYMLLETTEKKIEEIAKSLGFKDVYYFGRIFKKKTGISPGRYRRR